MNKMTIIIGIITVAGIVMISLFSKTKEKQVLNNVMNISASEFEQKIQQEPGIVIDVRTQEEYNEGHLAKTDRHLDFLNGDFEAQLDYLDKDTTYYLYCRTGNRSGKAATLMINNGFQNVYNIGGFRDLVNAGQESK